MQKGDRLMEAGSPLTCYTSADGSLPAGVPGKDLKALSEACPQAGLQRHSLCFCLPPTGYRGVQKDEPSPESPVLRASKNWKGELPCPHHPADPVTDPTHTAVPAHQQRLHQVQQCPCWCFRTGPMRLESGSVKRLTLLLFCQLSGRHHSWQLHSRLHPSAHGL